MPDQAFAIALIGALGIGAQWVAWRTGWPAIALMLAAGVIAGPVTGLIDPEHVFGELLEPMVSIAVALILFEGGLSLNLRELRKTEGAVTRLVVLGVPIGWALGALACYYVAGLVWPVAILFGGILVVTGPTVVIPLLRQSNVAARPRAILKWEGIVNDPFGALCAVLTYEYLRRAGEGATLFEVTLALVGAVVIAGLIGYGAARAVAWAFPRGYVPEYLKAPILLVAVIGTFVGSNAIQSETGLFAVTLFGIALANMHLDSLRDIHPFKENVTVLLISGVFVILSASLDFDAVRQFEWRFLAFLAAILFLVRPATVLLSLAFSRIPWNERLLIAWIAPRGIVAVAISGLFALHLRELGYSDGGILVSLSFLIVTGTILAHGFSIRHVARWLKVTGAEKQGLLLVGSTSWSLKLAEQLRQLEVPVTIADASWQRLTPARQAGIPTFHGEILAETTEDQLDMSQFQVLAATSTNEAYNALVCTEFAPEIGRDSVYQLGDASDDDPRSLPESLRGRAMFASGLGVEEILEREAQGWEFRKTKIGEHYDFESAKAALPEGGDMLMLVRKNGSLRFFTHASRPTPQPGDTAISFGPPRKRAARKKKEEVTGEAA